MKTYSPFSVTLKSSGYKMVPSILTTHSSSAAYSSALGIVMLQNPVPVVPVTLKLKRFAFELKLKLLTVEFVNIGT